ncbi:hypothetical protein Tco_0126730 [Tanacetum coccineum]
MGESALSREMSFPTVKNNVFQMTLNTTYGMTPTSSFKISVRIIDWRLLCAPVKKLSTSRSLQTMDRHRGIIMECGRNRAACRNNLDDARWALPIQLSKTPIGVLRTSWYLVKTAFSTAVIKSSSYLKIENFLGNLKSVGQDNFPICLCLSLWSTVEVISELRATSKIKWSSFSTLTFGGDIPA